MGALSRWDETGFYWRAIPFGLSAEGVASNAPPGFAAHLSAYGDLSRLRHSIGDELFIPSESGMQPTRRALDLASAVREGLEKLELALSGKESLPVEALRTFRIAACDCACMVILPSPVKRLAKSAPHVDLRVFPSNRLDVVRQLEKREADLVIGWFDKLPAGIRRSTLLQEDEVIVVRAGHPLTRRKVTKEGLNEFPHLVVVLTGAEENKADGFMNKEGVSARTWIESVLHEFQDGKIDPVGRAAVCVPHFAAMTPFLQLTDMVAMLPRRLAFWAAAHAPIVLLDLPYESMTVNMEMLWGHMGPKRQPGSRSPVARKGIRCIYGGCGVGFSDQA